MGTAVAQLTEVQSFDTLALHAGAVADPTTGALLTPIYQTTTYRQEAVGKTKDSLTAVRRIQPFRRWNAASLHSKASITVRVMQPDSRRRPHSVSRCCAPAITSSFHKPYMEERYGCSIRYSLRLELPQSSLTPQTRPLYAMH